MQRTEEILSCLRKYSPNDFERFVLKFLLKIEDAEYGEVTGRTGDEGIDGFVRLDKLGLSKVFFQAKRWNETIVGRPEVQKFVGALHGKKAEHGIFVTVSSFSDEARSYVQQIDTKVRLIDGKELTDLLLTNNLQNLVEESFLDSSIEGQKDSFGNEVILNEKGNRIIGDGAKRFYGRMEGLSDKALQKLEKLLYFPAERKFLIFSIEGDFKVELKSKKDVDEILDKNLVVVYRIKNIEDAPRGSEVPSEAKETVIKESDDGLYDQAVEIVARSKQASTSLLQRWLKVSYGRAARLLDDMEIRGVVGPVDGNKPRKILIQSTSEMETLEDDVEEDVIAAAMVEARGGDVMSLKQKREATGEEKESSRAETKDGNVTNSQHGWKALIRFLTKK